MDNTTIMWSWVCTGTGTGLNLACPWIPIPLSTDLWVCQVGAIVCQSPFIHWNLKLHHSPTTDLRSFWNPIHSTIHQPLICGVFQHFCTTLVLCHLEYYVILDLTGHISGLASKPVGTLSKHHTQNHMDTVFMGMGTGTGKNTQGLPMSYPIDTVIRILASMSQVTP